MATNYETSCSSDDEAQQTQKKAKVTYERKFRTEWLSQKEFKDWLIPPCKNNRSPMCSLCNKPVKSHRSSLLKHCLAKSHVNSAKAKEACKSVKTAFQHQTDQGLYKENTEVQVAAFIAEHNLPFTLSAPLLDLIKSRAPRTSADSATLAQIKLSDTKCVNIVRQGIGLYFAEELVLKLRNTKFSIIPDETTDVSTEKQLGIIVVFWDDENMEIIVRFFDLVPVHCSTAKGLYSAIKNSLLEKIIPLANVIGYSSDTTNVMFGASESVVALLKNDMPHVVAIKCSCHLIHLCASYACLKLSTTLEDMLRNVHAHFSRSSHRTHNLEEFQRFCELPVHKILTLSQTRWLSMENVVNRVLEQWPALELYFTDLVASKKDPSNTVGNIVQVLNNKFMKAQLEFISFQLKRLNAFNTLFQSETAVLHHLRGEVTKLLKELLSDFVKMDVVRSGDPFHLDLKNERNRVHIDHVYVGVTATCTLSDCSKLDPNGVRHVRVICREFMVELVEQIRTRFGEIKNKVYDDLDFLSPSNATQCHPPSLAGLYDNFTFLNDIAPLELVDLEWRKQAIEERNILTTGESDLQFWKERMNQRNVGDKLKYANLRKVVGCMMSLPCANAPVERLFSALKSIKSDKRNCLKRESTVGLLHGKFGMNTIGVSADKLKVQDHPKLLKLVRNVRSNATDSESNDLIKEAFRIQ